MKKNIVFLALALLLATAAFAQTEADFEVELTKDGTGVVITNYIGKVAAVKIPTTIQGMPVREIGGAAFHKSPYDAADRTNNTITSVVIPQGVTKIGSSAFLGAPNLTSVTLPEGLTEIGNSAFDSCPLTAITLPQSLTTLGDGTFAGSKITAITLPGSLTKKGRELFRGCKNLKTVTISEGITAITDRQYSRMFAGCTALTTVTLPSTLTTIGDEDFKDCTALTAITLPASIEEIGKEAFSGCTALTTITIPETVQEIIFYGGGIYGSFKGCTKLTLATHAALKRVGYEDGF